MKLRCLGSQTLLVLAISAIMVTSPVQAQRPGQRGGGQRSGMMGGGMRMGGGNPASSLLRREDVQKELELLDDQIEQLQGLEEKLREETRGMFSGMQNLREMSAGEREKAMEKMRANGQKLQAKLQTQVKDILLPHQSERLDQLMFQMGTRGGLTGALANPEIRQKLGITDDQKEDLEAKGQALEEGLRKKIEKLRLEARAKLLKSLTSEQQAKFKKMIGKPFEFQQQPRRPGGQQRPGRPQGRRAR